MEDTLVGVLGGEEVRALAHEAVAEIKGGGAAAEFVAVEFELVVRVGEDALHPADEGGALQQLTNAFVTQRGNRDVEVFAMDAERLFAAEVQEAAEGEVIGIVDEKNPLETQLSEHAAC